MTFALPARHKLCAVVTTYHPDARFPDYLSGISAQCNEVIIVDNGSAAAAIAMLRRTSGVRVALIEMGRNTGLGAALNHGIAQAKTRGYSWVVLFDQDSIPLGDMAETFCKILAAHPEPDKVAIIGSTFIDRNRQTAADGMDESPGKVTWKEKKRVITSGMLLLLGAFDGIGPFREDFFVDTIDHEYCYRARANGWHVVQAGTPLLSHSVGNYRRHRFLGAQVWRSHHSALRCYFMTRNPLLLAWDQQAYAKLLRGSVKAIKNSFLILLFEENKLGKLAATLSGYRDGLLRRTSMPQRIQRQIRQGSPGTPES